MSSTPGGGPPPTSSPFSASSPLVAPPNVARFPTFDVLLAYVSGAALSAAGISFPKESSRKLPSVAVVDQLPSREQAFDLVARLTCEKCGSQKLGLVGFETNPPVAVVMARCKDCLTDTHVFLSTKDDVRFRVVHCLAPMKGTHATDQLSSTNCFECGAPNESLETPSFRFKRIWPTLLKCTKCPASVNFIFHETPINYYVHNIQIADSVKSTSAAAALVFYASALEVYLQKAFAFHSDFNDFLITNRRVSFQDLRGATDIYKASFGLDLPSLAGVGWQTLVAAFKQRNLVVHHASMDQDFNPIVIAGSFLDDVKRETESLVRKKLDEELRRRLVY